MIIIDLEFTGLDNSYVKDNEIVQLKTLDTEDKSEENYVFKTKKQSCASAFLCHRIDNSDREHCFTKEFFETIIEPHKGKEFIGFGVQQDIKMLFKYGINLSIKDIKEILTLSKFEQRLALEGSSLEACYLIVTGQIPIIDNHGGIDELHLIKEIYDHIKESKLNDFLNYVPFGHCAGMPLSEYVRNYRRQSDGYRFNNNDLYAQSLDYEISKIEDF